MAEAITAETFDKVLAGSAKPVLVDFWASWCGPCRMVGPFVEQIADEYAGKAVVAKVNVDDSPELAAKFSVTSIPTLITFKDGVLVDQQMGARPKAMIAAMIEDAK